MHLITFIDMSNNQHQHAVTKPTAGAKGSIVFKGGVAHYQAPPKKKSL